ncbi:MAG: hypothetical protein V4714_19200 [Bacteroidota bacterium]
MRKELYSFIGLLTLFTSVCAAQPGYQGKKLSIQGSMYFMPALVNANYSKKSGLLTFNTASEASLDYVVGKRNSLGMSYRHARTSNLLGEGKEGVSPDKVFTNSVGIYYRLYRRDFGNIAPLGRYLQMGAGMMFNKVIEESGTTTSFNMYSIRVGLGKNRVLFDRLLVSYGWEFAYSFTGFNAEGVLGATYYYKDEAPSMAQYRLLRHSMLNLKVGIGFLAK